ncbi:hypothetical protein GGR26_001231 [Lewinella marina]|uniref:DUF1573 domain-containing protein n=1 Tax=Neolewinella marina TaxID=438751 RepID=A0A2G0CFR5_9BACT|nr:DUF1573 domain-containing protein [Neolewinella marina]NJB85486.1 hypothetical protein [Neolewinella marina]PHK98824.1 hypothetical protein CGL56_10200 [Neolewinella marina]
MLRISVILLLLAGLWACSDAPADEGSVEEKPAGTTASLIRNPVADQDAAPADTSLVAKLTFEEPEYHFGEVKEGTTVRRSFRFTNTGRAPLLITDARSTCGCTVPSYPRQPIAPGEGGVVEVVFNTAHKYGRQRKPVTLTANTYPSLTTIYVDGTIINE